MANEAPPTVAIGLKAYLARIEERQQQMEWRIIELELELLRLNSAKASEDDELGKELEMLGCLNENDFVDFDFDFEQQCSHDKQ